MAKQKTQAQWDAEQDQWWKEEAQRHNQLGEIAKKAGHQIKSNLMPPEQLNHDGSIKESTDNQDSGWAPINQ